MKLLSSHAISQKIDFSNPNAAVQFDRQIAYSKSGVDAVEDKIYANNGRALVFPIQMQLFNMIGGWHNLRAAQRSRGQKLYFPRQAV